MAVVPWLEVVQTGVPWGMPWVGVQAAVQEMIARGAWAGVAWTAWTGPSCR